MSEMKDIADKIYADHIEERGGVFYVLPLGLKSAIVAALKEAEKQGRSAAYQGGWSDGYAEGLGKGLNTAFPDISPKGAT